MDKALVILELITFSLMILFIALNIINTIRESKPSKLDDYICDKLEQLLDALDGLEAADEKIENKATTEDYENYNILDLKKIAKSKKIKGYYNMKKSELVKTLKEAE